MSTLAESRGDDAAGDDGRGDDAQKRHRTEAAAPAPTDDAVLDRLALPPSRAVWSYAYRVPASPEEVADPIAAVAAAAGSTTTAAAGSDVPDAARVTAVRACDASDDATASVEAADLQALPVLAVVTAAGALHWYRKVPRGFIFAKYDTVIDDAKLLAPAADRMPPLLVSRSTAQTLAVVCPGASRDTLVIFDTARTQCVAICGDAPGDAFRPRWAGNDVACALPARVGAIAVATPPSAVLGTAVVVVADAASPQLVLLAVSLQRSADETATVSLLRTVRWTPQPVRCMAVKDNVMALVDAAGIIDAVHLSSTPETWAPHPAPAQAQAAVPAATTAGVSRPMRKAAPRSAATCPLRWERRATTALFALVKAKAALMLDATLTRHALSGDYLLAVAAMLPTGGTATTTATRVVLVLNVTSGALVAAVPQNVFARSDAVNTALGVPADRAAAIAKSLQHVAEAHGLGDTIAQAAFEAHESALAAEAAAHPTEYGCTLAFTAAGNALLFASPAGVVALSTADGTVCAIYGAEAALSAPTSHVALLQSSVASTQVVRDVVKAVSLLDPAHPEVAVTRGAATAGLGNAQLASDKARTFEAVVVTAASRWTQPAGDDRSAALAARALRFFTDYDSGLGMRTALPPPFPSGAPRTAAGTRAGAAAAAAASNNDAFSTADLESATRAVIETNHGDVTVALFPSETPRTVHNFVVLARRGFYAGLTFHRVIKGFMLQGGCPRGDGTGGESAFGGPFDDEITPRRMEQFCLCMANRGPGTNESQFFITTAPTPWLQGKHTVFGEVLEGHDVVRAIERQPVSQQQDKPLRAVMIRGVRIADSKDAA